MVNKFIVNMSQFDTHKLHKYKYQKGIVVALT